MTDTSPSHPHQPEPPRPDDERREAVRTERWELLDHIQAILEPAMTGLGIVFLVLLLVDYADIGIGPIGRQRIDQALQAIWAVFVLDFAIRLVIAPAKLAFLRANVLTVVSLALPFLRPLRAFRAVRGVRSLSLVRLLGGINRGMRVLRRVARGRQLVFVAILTVVMAMAGAVGAVFFEDGYADAPIQTLWDAIWWSSTLVTTMNSEKYVVSPEGRVLGILLRVYALSVFGYITASIATYLIGASGAKEADPDERDALRGEIAALREEVASLRRALEREPDA